MTVAISDVLNHRPHRIGSLCSGYGGLDLAVQEALGGTITWHADNDPSASRILARHWPTVPNLADITTVDWAEVPQVCILTAGFPCQRRFGRRPPCRSRSRHPFRPMAARRPCGRGPPPPSGGDRKRPRPPHGSRAAHWRPGTLPVVSGRPASRASSARTRRRTRLPGRHRVRRSMARPTRFRRRRPAPPRPDLPHRVAAHPVYSKHQRGIWERTAAASTRRNDAAAATVRTSPTKSSGCCRPRRPPTARRAPRANTTATAT
jgi:hypothetical protein